MKAVCVILPAFLVCAAAHAQSEPARMEFEVASVKPAAPGVPGQIPVGVHVDGAQVSFRYLPLQDLMISAYQIKKHQIVGPDWLSTERYDIQAKVPSGLAPEVIRDKIREMLQSLLEDRFKLKYHKETRDLPVYALTVAKSGSRLKESPADPELDAASQKAFDVRVQQNQRGATVSLPNGASITYGFLFLEARRVAMPSLADNLARLVDRPVIDDTGLKGLYDFKLEFSVEEMRSMMRTSGTDPNLLAGVPDNMGTSVLTSLQSLGLKLESRKAPMEVYVIDRAEKTPTEN
ncbi:MAG TPA: TIGR03435 family protein [Candidatus Acidoferrales bacterium]|nr:TIGR03435 family protein [Candidatus Acidoferrales bacterium]